MLTTKRTGERRHIEERSWERLKKTPSEAGCSQEDGPKKGFVMGSRAQGVQDILEKCV